MPGTPINKLHPLAKGLVGYWLLNDGGTLVWDYSDNGNHGILTNMDPATDWVAGKFGYALDFDGVDDYADVPNSPELNNQYVTFLVWVQCGITNYTDDAHIVNKYNTNPATVILYIDDADDTFKFGVRLDGAEGAVQKVAANVAVDLNWHQVAGTYDGDNIKLYIDGVLQTDINSSSGTIDIDNPNILGIAHRPVTGGFYFNGLIDNICVYNRALSLQEVQQLFIAPFSMFERPSSARHFLVVGGTAYFKTLTETVSLVDVPQKAMSKPLVESIGLVASTPPKDLGITKPEVLTLIDDISKGIGTSKIENLILVDTFSRMASYVRTLVDSLTLVDSISKGTGRTITEMVSLVDSLSKGIGITKNEILTLIDDISKGTSKSITEVITLLGVLSKIGTFIRTLGETVTLVDILSKGAGKSLTEIVTLTDNIQKDFSRLLIEAISLIDDVSKTTGKTFLEIITLLDNVVPIFGKLFTETLILSDNIQRDTGKLLKEATLTLVDSISKDITITKSESLALVDVVSSLLSPFAPTFVELAKLLAYISVVENIQAKESDTQNIEAKESATENIKSGA